MEIACIGVQASQFMRVEDVDYQKVLMPTVEMCFAVTGRGHRYITMIGNSLQIRIRPYYAYTRKLTQIISGNTDTNNKMEM
jgi:hypothetical protein